MCPVVFHTFSRVNYVFDLLADSITRRLSLMRDLFLFAFTPIVLADRVKNRPMSRKKDLGSRFATFASPYCLSAS